MAENQEWAGKLTKKRNAHFETLTPQQVKDKMGFLPKPRSLHDEANIPTKPK
jgi:hypothetical protein